MDRLFKPEMADQMDLSLNFSFNDLQPKLTQGQSEEVDVNENEENDAFFGQLISLLEKMLMTSELCLYEDENLICLTDYLKQTNEALQSGQLPEEEPDPFLELFQISEMAARLCTSYNEANKQNPNVEHLKEVFYLSNEIFIGAQTKCSELNIKITKLNEILSFIKSCQKLDIKLFLQTSKNFIATLENNYDKSNPAVNFEPIDFMNFLQSIIFTDYLIAEKRTPTSFKIAGFVLRNLSSAYASRFGSECLANEANSMQACQFLLQVHSLYWDVSKKATDGTLIAAFKQFINPSVSLMIRTVMCSEHFLPCLIESFTFDDLKSTLKSAWMCFVTNTFTILGESKMICQTCQIEQLLDNFLCNYSDWISDENAYREWPWPLIGSAKFASAQEAIAWTAARLVLQSAFEEASQFFQFEQILILGLTGKARPVETCRYETYPALVRVIISDCIVFMAKSSRRLSFRYTQLFAEFIAKTAENDEVAASLVPALLRRIFDSSDDEDKARLVQQAIEEILKSYSHLLSSSFSKSTPVFSMVDSFRILESATNSILQNDNNSQSLSPGFIILTVRLFSYLTWWISAKPEALKSCRQVAEKLTFSMWQVLSMADVASKSPSHSFLMLFAQSVFEASRTIIIGVANYESSAKFWAAAGEFFEMATLPRAVKELFVVWMLKTVDSNTLACSEGAQKVIDKCLWNEANSSTASLLHGVVISNIANRLNPKVNPNAMGLSSRLNPKLRIQAEAFNQQLFCIPFSNLG